MTQDENSININLANQLFILEHNISEKTNIFCKRQYEIKDLQVKIYDYEYISQFNVTTMFQEEIDIILGLRWLTKLDTFILNMEKKFVTFPYKKKMMNLQDINFAYGLIFHVFSQKKIHYYKNDSPKCYRIKLFYLKNRQTFIKII